MAPVIRDERPADVPAVARMLEAAFGQADEARLVAALRRDGDAAISLIAEDRSGVVGCVTFSPMQAPAGALGLAPLAVAPERQEAGVGAALVRAGLDRATAEGWTGVFLLGEPRYYARFGFTPERANGFESPFAGPHFMALALRADFPAQGRAAYAPAFRA